MRRLALALAALAVVLSVPGAAVTTWLDWQDLTDLPYGISFALMGVVSAVTGAAVASRVPHNAVGWIILALGVGVGVLLAVGAYAELSATRAAETLPAEAVAAWLGDILGIPVFFGLTGFLLLLFPSGRLLSRRWLPFAWFFGVTVAVAALSYGLIPQEIGSGIDNPYALDGAAGDVAQVTADVTDWIALPGMVMCAVALALRLRRSRGVERQQLKWFTYAAAVAGVGLGVTVLTRGVVADVAFLAGLLGVVLLPLTAGIAIMRYRLYDIDVVIKRTLVYATLTATLVATYLVLVLLLQEVLHAVAGQSHLAVAGSTLTVAALFRPLRGAIQRGVDRRFFRSRYDAARTLETFSDRLRQELDLHQLGTDLRAVVHDTMQPTHVSLWLRRTP